MNTYIKTLTNPFAVNWKMEKKDVPQSLLHFLTKNAKTVALAGGFSALTVAALFVAYKAFSFPSTPDTPTTTVDCVDSTDTSLVENERDATSTTPPQWMETTPKGKESGPQRRARKHRNRMLSMKMSESGIAMMEQYRQEASLKRKFFAAWAEAAAAAAAAAEEVMQGASDASKEVTNTANHAGASMANEEWDTFIAESQKLTRNDT